MDWQPIETAPTDGTMVLVYAPGAEWELPDYIGPCEFHPDGGWCVCELRYVTHWIPMPPLPQEPNNGR